MWSFVVSINTLLRGVVTPASPITPITGPSAAVPSCLCPVWLWKAFAIALYSLLNIAAVMVSPSENVLCRVYPAIFYLLPEGT